MFATLSSRSLYQETVLPCKSNGWIEKAGVIEVLEGRRQGQIELPTVNENNVLFPSELHCSKFGFLKVSLLSRTGTEGASMVASLVLGHCK